MPLRQKGEIYLTVKQPANKKSRLNWKNIENFIQVEIGYQNKTTTPVLVWKSWWIIKTLEEIRDILSLVSSRFLETCWHLKSYRHSKSLKTISKDRLLIESDGPYSKVDGKKFSPSLLREEYELIAKSLYEPELIRVIFNNFKNLLLTK